MVPDPQRWNFALQAKGDVDAETASSRGPATFYSESHSRYTAHKSLVVDRQGVRTAPADVGADTDVALQGLETKLDAIPVLNWIVRSVALRQHDRHYDEARGMATARLEEMAGERIDEEVHRQLANAEQEFQQKWLAPLRSLKLKPQALDMQTTSEQLLVRYRLAGDAQLAAHTPRPVPPAGSLLDVQIHETALNNALEQLGLEGKRCELRALYRELADTFQRSDVQVPDDMPEGVTVQFADRHAIRVRCDDDRVSLTIRIAELKNHRRKAWRNFAVRATDAPDATQINANLVRDGYIELAGQRLNTMDQVALRSIFTTALSRNRPFSLVSKQLAQNPRMSDVQVTQFAIHDGWIGIALVPKEAAHAGESRGRRRLHSPVLRFWCGFEPSSCTDRVVVRRRRSLYHVQTVTSSSGSDLTRSTKADRRSTGFLSSKHPTCRPPWWHLIPTSRSPWRLCVRSYCDFLASHSGARPTRRPERIASAPAGRPV